MSATPTQPVSQMTLTPTQQSASQMYGQTLAKGVLNATAAESSKNKRLAAGHIVRCMYGTGNNTYYKYHLMLSPATDTNPKCTVFQLEAEEKLYRNSENLPSTLRYQPPIVLLKDIDVVNSHSAIKF